MDGWMDGHAETPPLRLGTFPPFSFSHAGTDMTRRGYVQMADLGMWLLGLSMGMGWKKAWRDGGEKQKLRDMN